MGKKKLIFKSLEIKKKNERMKCQMAVNHILKKRSRFWLPDYKENQDGHMIIS